MQGVFEGPHGILTSTPRVTQARKLETGNVALTPPQESVLRALREFIRGHGIPPTRAELGAMVGLRYQAAVDNHLQRMAKKGWVEVKYGVERGLVPLREGAPLYEPEDLRPTPACVRLRGERPKEPKWLNYELLWEMFGAMPDLCLRIRDDAMNRAGLADAGIVALTRKPDEAGNMTINDDDIVAARIADDVVLRRVHAMDAGTFELRPESRSRRHRTIWFDTRADEVEIIGVVIGRMLAGAG